MEKIICTFDKPELEEFSHPDLLFAPLIRVAKLDYRLERSLDTYEWLFFTSKNAIRFFDRIHDGSFKGNIAVLGESTAKELEQYGYKADFVGDGSSSVNMAKSLINIVVPGQKVLAVLGKISSFNLQIAMGEKHRIDRVDVYDTHLESLQNKEIRQLILSDDYRLILAASPSAVRSLVLNFGGKEILWRVACIGETTAQACRSLGINPLMVSTKQNFKTLLKEAMDFQIENK